VQQRLRRHRHVFVGHLHGRLPARQARRAEAAARATRPSAAPSAAARGIDGQEAHRGATSATQGPYGKATWTQPATVAPRRAAKAKAAAPAPPPPPRAASPQAPPPPPPPLRLSAPGVAVVRGGGGAGGASRALLTWTPLPRACTYIAERACVDAGTAAAGPWERVGATSGEAEAAPASAGGDVAAAPLLRLACDAPMAPGARYAFRITARLRGGGGGSDVITSAVAEASAPAAAPGPCAPPAARREAGAAIAVTWQPPACDGGAPTTSYRLEAASAAAGAAAAAAGPYVAVWAGSATSAALRPAALAQLSASCAVPQLLRFRVRALNAIGAGPPSAASLPVAAPAMPAAVAPQPQQQAAVVPRRLSRRAQKAQPAPPPPQPAPQPAAGAAPRAAPAARRHAPAATAPVARHPPRRRRLRDLWRLLRRQWRNIIAAVFIAAFCALALARRGASYAEIAADAARFRRGA
jgi:hypothetical protein